MLSHASDEYLMKSAFTLLLGGIGAIAVLAPVWAQSTDASRPVVPQATLPQGQSVLLNTQPLEIGPGQTRHAISGLDTTTLNTVANSIQAHPSSSASEGEISPSLIPKDLFRTPSKLLSDTHPLETFQPPAPNQSFGINLNRL